MRKLVAVAILSALTTQVAACGSQTTYRLRSGDRVAGEIAGRIDNTLYIRADRGKITLDACEVTDVSHPGKGIAITGSALLGVGGLILLGTLGAWSSNGGRDDESILIVGGVYSTAFLATGGALAGWGYTHWNGSETRTGELPASGCEGQNESDRGRYALDDVPAEPQAPPARPAPPPATR